MDVSTGIELLEKEESCSVGKFRDVRVVGAWSLGKSDEVLASCNDEGEKSF